MGLRVLSWILYIVGIALVLGGYFGIVSSAVSWVGWVIGMAGWAMTFLPAFRRNDLVGDLERLAKLHAEGKLSDEEFAAAKLELTQR